MNKWLNIHLKLQQLSLMDDDKVVANFAISSAKNGVGCTQDSGCTPIGRHRVRLKIGEGCHEHTVFIGRRATGEIYSARLGREYPERDWILGRILWLQGLEPGINQGRQVDSLRRFIYIHGTPESEPLGIAASKGCIRMHPGDMLEVFDFADNNILVEINL